jgi:putative transposase
MNAVAGNAPACQTFQISETCYRYSPVLSDESKEIADWLQRLSANKRTWGFGLCFLHLRNVQGYGWNHNRVYRIYCKLERNLRIKPKKRLKRDKPEPLAVPDSPGNVSGKLMAWAGKQGVHLEYIQPGKPQQNA